MQCIPNKDKITAITYFTFSFYEFIVENNDKYSKVGIFLIFIFENGDFSTKILATKLFYLFSILLNSRLKLIELKSVTAITYDHKFINLI